VGCALECRADPSYARLPVNWVIVIWSMVASACLTLALIHLVIWFRGRDFVQLLFAAASLGVAGIAAGELAIMLAQTPEQIAYRIRLIHVPIFVAVVSIVWFVRLYFDAGRTWLAWLITAVRGTVLILNFCVWPNLNYTQVTGLRGVPLWGGVMVSMPVGTVSPLSRLGELASLLLLVFVVDAGVSGWRRGTRDQRRRALVIGGSVVFFVLFGAGHVALIHAGLGNLPYMISLAFLVPVTAMGYQLGIDVVRATRLSQELGESQTSLRENELRMELAESAAQLGLWRWDIRADEVWVNENGRALLGLNGAERLGMERFLAALVPEDRDPVQRAIDHALRAGVDYESEFRVRDAHGSVRWLSARGRVEYDQRRAPVLMRGVSFDITERRNAESEQLRQRQELAHLSRVAMLGELSGSLAHELNQPLSAILSNAQAAQEFLSAKPVDLDEVRGILQDIVSEDRRAGEIIRRLRLLFRKGEVQHEPIDLNGLILEVLKLMNSEQVNHGVTLQTELAPELPAVTGDRVQLQQVLINLIMNAFDAMGGLDMAERTLTIATRLDSEDRVEIRVADTGCGIPLGHLERIFEPFHTTKAHGMGLGLAVCRTIISAHAGVLRATNNPDRGACLYVTLPPQTAGVP
jgi:PAS domain S-box-containing protein